MNRTYRTAGMTCATGILLASMIAIPAPAAAVGPPGIDQGALGAAMAVNAKNGPPEETEQRIVCAKPVLNGAPPKEAPIAQRLLNLPGAWQFSRGAGQKVAVIDTGVNPHPRLPVQGGGDFVSASDGTVDCDGHGTLVAGIIAARPAPDDAFAGVAPEAEVLAIRQVSMVYEPKNRQSGPPPGALGASGYGTVTTMAAAIIRAVDLGATVINISEVACTPAGGDTADAALGAAVKLAYERDVVVIAAAGNVQQDGTCQTQNEGAGWGAVRTVASPAWFAPYVLTVGSVDPDGRPSAFSLNGPWVGVSAVGRDIVSLDSTPGSTGLVNAVQSEGGTRPVDGTSFAAPYVAGLAALIRARFPELSASQVMERIIRTAHAPGTGHDDRVGAGLVDPLAALTAQLPADRGDAVASRAIPEPARPVAQDPVPRRIAFAGSAVCLIGLGIGIALAIPPRRRAREADADIDSYF